MSLSSIMPNAHDDLEQQVERVQARSALELGVHEKLLVEMAAIQEELERRVSLATKRRGKLPWRKSSS